MGDPTGPARQAGALLGLTLTFGLGMMAGPSAAARADDTACPEPESWSHDRLDIGFERERRFDGMETPMRSRGRVQSDGAAILWRTEAPIAMVMRIDGEGVSQSVAGGPMRPMAGTAQGSAEVAGLIATLLSGDLASAAAHFTIDKRQDPASGDWHVELEPGAAALARVIERIEMTGCESVEMIVIEQPNGDQDRVVFGEAD